MREELAGLLLEHAHHAPGPRPRRGPASRPRAPRSMPAARSLLRHLVPCRLHRLVHGQLGQSVQHRIRPEPGYERRARSLSARIRSLAGHPASTTIRTSIATNRDSVATTPNRYPLPVAACPLADHQPQRPERRATPSRRRDPAGLGRQQADRASNPRRNGFVISFGKRAVLADCTTTLAACPLIPFPAIPLIGASK